LIRGDGSRDRLLGDHETGWHAGNWDVYCRSVGICFDGQFGREQPTPEMISAASRLLQDRYPDVATSRVFGHREINLRTTCPGSTFLDGWKDSLTGLLD
jgi:N-acetyl-anhydromuramyl-L-alanine amidase AmpD